MSISALDIDIVEERELFLYYLMSISALDIDIVEERELFLYYLMRVYRRWISI